jgi:hypothetical protein
MTAKALAVIVIGASLMAARDGRSQVVHRLELVSEQAIVWSGELRSGGLFEVSFEHSAEKCRWTQHYRAAGPGRIQQLSSTFPCIGAGMPWSSTDGSPAIRTREGYTLVAARTLADIHMINSCQGQILLSVGNQHVDVSSRMDDFQRFTLRIR